MNMAMGNAIFVSMIFLFVISVFVICVFAMRKRRYIKAKIILGVIFVLAAIIISILMSWIHPVKYAIEEKNFSDYSKYILVREVHYTGTGWSMVGDTEGYFPSEEVVLKNIKNICEPNQGV